MIVALETSTAISVSLLLPAYQAPLQSLTRLYLHLVLEGKKELAKYEMKDIGPNWLERRLQANSWAKNQTTKGAKKPKESSKKK